MRRFPRPSHMDTTSGGCLGWFCLACIGAICWPLAIPATIIFALWYDSGENTQQTIIQVIFLIAIGFIAVASPILAFASLFSVFENWDEPLALVMFWVITIIEIVVAVIFVYPKLKHNIFNKMEQKNKREASLKFKNTLPYVDMNLENIEFTFLGKPFISHNTKQEDNGTFSTYLIYRWYFDFDKRIVSAMAISHGEKIDEITFYGKYSKFNQIR